MWGDVDLANGVVHIRRSRHLFGYNAPKTKTARRAAELFPETVRLLHAIKALHVQPDTPVFTSTTGTPIEPKSFSEHFYRAQRALNIRPLGLYCTKDTFVTTALEAGVKIAWLEQQTGVRAPGHPEHRFRGKPNTHSDGSRTPIPGRSNSLTG
jgi:integrase